MPCYIRLLGVPSVFLHRFVFFLPAGGPALCPVSFSAMEGAYPRTLYSVLRILSAMSMEACPSARYITMSFLSKEACRRSYRLRNPARWTDTFSSCPGSDSPLARIPVRAAISFASSVALRPKVLTNRLNASPSACMVQPADGWRPAGNAPFEGRTHAGPAG